MPPYDLTEAFRIRAQYARDLAAKQYTPGGVATFVQAMAPIVEAKMTERRMALAAAWDFQKKADLARQMGEQLGFAVMPGETPAGAFRRKGAEDKAAAVDGSNKAYIDALAGEGIDVTDLTPDMDPVALRSLGGARRTKGTKGAETDALSMASRDLMGYVEKNPNLAGAYSSISGFLNALTDAEGRPKYDADTIDKAMKAYRGNRIPEETDKDRDAREARLAAEAEERSVARERSYQLAVKRLDLAERALERAKDEDERRAARAEVDDARADAALEARGIEEMEGNPYMTRVGKDRLRGILDAYKKRVPSGGLGTTPSPKEARLKELRPKIRDNTATPEENAEFVRLMEGK